MRKRQLGVICIVSALAAGPALAQDRDADWLKRPTPESLREVFPSAALRKGKSGKAAISCTVTVQGTLRNCEVLSQEPADLGFGGAALALAPQFLMKPALKGGVPVEGTVRIPINWDLSGMGPQPRPAQGDKVYSNLPWRRAPTVEQVLAAYPAKAKAAKVGGAAILDCRIGKDGGISKCQTVREQPTGQGFAAAAKSLAPLFTTPIDTGKGETAAGARAHVNITFAASAIDAEKPVIGRPKWVAIPRINDMAAMLPEAAKKAKVYKARVVMDCKVVAEGAVDGCKVVSQDPTGLGYDQAALMLSKYFRLAVWTEEGLPSVGGLVSIPLRFDLESAMAAVPTPARP
jgi:TonB family protein